MTDQEQPGQGKVMSDVCTISEAEPKGGGLSKLRQWWPKSVRVIIAVILYVFSIGPMFWYWYEAENMGGNPLMRVLYAPLRLLCVIPQIEDWLNNYINWWIA
tara:strand:- start:4245 stop:4550 length:306 start_codon:yes stop_codon:yes gene_type:complete